MLYFAKPGVGMAYLVTWLLIMYIGTSILTLAHSAWAATLARTYDERSRLYGIMAAVGVLGSTAVLATPGVLNLIDPSKDVGVLAMGWFILAFVPLAVILVVWRTPERLAPEAKGQRFTLKDYISLAARPSMGRIIVADFFLSLGPQWTGALYVFFFTDSRGFTRAETMWLLVLYMFAGFFGAPLIARLAMAISKHRTAMISIAGWGIILASLMLTPSGNIPIGAIQMFALGFLAAGFNVVTRAMTADVADEIRLEQGLERSGLLFAFTTLTTKLAGAMGIFASYQVLGAVDYKSGVENTPEAIHGMMLAYIVVPVVFMIVAALCLRGYPLSKEKHADIRRELEIRDASLLMQDTAIAVDNGPPPEPEPAKS
jgi:Na+/melibiose symporter-like transporter